MPVSKKRKKDGKPVSRQAAANPEHPHGPEAKPEVLPQKRMGQPKNPFVSAQQQTKRGAQRGR
jgi:hypothetical protein